MSVRTLSMNASDFGHGRRSIREFSYYEYNAAPSDVRLDSDLSEFARLSLGPAPSKYFHDSQSYISGSSKQFPNGCYPGSYTGVSHRSHYDPPIPESRLLEYAPSRVRSRGSVAAPSKIGSRAPSISAAEQWIPSPGSPQHQYRSSGSSPLHRPLFEQRRSSHEYDEGLPLVQQKYSQERTVVSQRRKKSSTGHHHGGSRRRDESVAPADSISNVSYSYRDEEPPRGRRRRREGSVAGGRGYQHGALPAVFDEREEVGYETVDITPYR